MKTVQYTKYEERGNYISTISLQARVYIYCRAQLYQQVHSFMCLSFPFISSVHVSLAAQPSLMLCPHLESVCC